ncbi:MAG: GyrI-like domain-containing protein [Streptosporangiaceae bacterium]
MTPEITERAEQPYVAITARVTMQEIGAFAQRHREVFGWLAVRNLAPAGPPFFRFNVIDMDRQLEMEAGVPVNAVVDGDDEVIAAVVPAGRYATVTYIGHPESLVTVTGELLDWAAQRGLQWDMTVGDDGEHWGARLENYLTDPREQPDMTKWETELAFRLAD